MKSTYNLQETYRKEIVPALSKELGMANRMAVPKLTKIVVGMGLGDALTDKKVLETMGAQLARITGQKPLVTRAKRSIATFKLRAGSPIGLKVTIRGKRMWTFLEKLIAIVLPRVRDFRGISKKGFDGKGNMTIGFSEMTIFPEINFEQLDKIRGLEVVLVTTAKTNEQLYKLLQKISFPFTKEG